MIRLLPYLGAIPQSSILCNSYCKSVRESSLLLKSCLLRKSMPYFIRPYITFLLGRRRISYNKITYIQRSYSCSSQGWRTNPCCCRNTPLNKFMLWRCLWTAMSLSSRQIKCLTTRHTRLVYVISHSSNKNHCKIQ